MSTSVSSLTAPITFSGSSTFSSSFQQVLQRAVAIAQLPEQQLQADINTLMNKQSDLDNMQNVFGSLQNAIQSISSAMTGSVSASSSDNAVAVASAQSNTLPGNYSIEVDNIGSSTTTLSSAGSTPVADPSSQNISSSLNYTLTVNGVPKTISIGSSSLSALANAINDANDGVSATIVNLGSNSSPDYRLSLTSTQLGPDTIQLNDGSNDLLSVVGQPGVLAQYKLNGSSTTLTSTTDQVTVAPGLTAILRSNSPGETVNITVAANQSSLASALSNFATSYNAAVSAVNAEHGQNAGALSGESIVFVMQSALAKIAQFVSTTGSVSNLSDLGLNLNSDGTMSFDSTKFNNQLSSGVQTFLGGLTSGGFLQLANDAIDSITDPVSGMLDNELSSLNTSITNKQGQISNIQLRVTTMQNNLQKQLAAADAAIAVLQEQTNYFTTLNQTMNANKMAGLT